MRKDFTANVSADNEVCMAYAKLIGSLTVVSHTDRGPSAVLYYNPTGLLTSEPPRFIFHIPENTHFQALVELKIGDDGAGAGSSSTGDGAGANSDGGNINGSGTGSVSGSGSGSGSGSDVADVSDD